MSIRQSTEVLIRENERLKTAVTVQRKAKEQQFLELDEMHLYVNRAYRQLFNAKVGNDLAIDTNEDIKKAFHALGQALKIEYGDEG